MKKAFFIPYKDITKDQCKDTGMAIVLILLIIGNTIHFKYFLPLAIIILVINMIFPTIYRIPALLWYNFSKILGAFVPKILLTVVYFVLVTPIAFFFKITGRDILKIKKFKKNTNSVFRDRNHFFIPDDIKHPY
jgi:hypothetical protein